MRFVFDSQTSIFRSLIGISAILSDRFYVPRRIYHRKLASLKNYSNDRPSSNLTAINLTNALARLHIDSFIQRCVSHICTLLVLYVCICSLFIYFLLVYHPYEYSIFIYYLYEYSLLIYSLYILPLRIFVYGDSRFQARILTSDSRARIVLSYSYLSYTSNLGLSVSTRDKNYYLTRFQANWR